MFIIELNLLFFFLVCSTRWSSRHQAISPIRYEYLNILKALTKIILLSKNKEDILEAEQILKNFENFNLY